MRNCMRRLAEHDGGPRAGQARAPGIRALARGFTLLELLAVIVIILIASAVALPVVLSALRGRQVSEAGRLVQGSLVGARDQAIHTGRPAGIRLLPDPAYPLEYDATAGRLKDSNVLAFNRVIPIASAPSYTNGRVSIYPDQDYSAITLLPCLVLEQAAVDAEGLITEPTSWWWNVRVGDQIQVGNSGPWYTIVGPMRTAPPIGNPEGYVNITDPATGQDDPRLIWTRNGVPVEYLFLTNGRDDGPMVGQVNAPPGPDGWIDSGWDGVDNDGNGQVDEPSEWERERWIR